MDFLDDEAIGRVSQKLNISSAIVKEAIRIYKVYKREAQSLSDKRRTDRALRLKQQALEKDKAEHPNRCFCKEDGFEVQRYFQDEKGQWEVRDRVVRTFTAYGHYDFRNEHPYQEPVYECSRCGKEWIEEIAYA